MLFYSLLILSLFTTAFAETTTPPTQPLQEPSSPTVSLTTTLTDELLNDRENALSQKQNSLTFYVKDLDTAKQTLPEQIKSLTDAEITQDTLDKAELNKKEIDVEIEKTNLALESAQYSLIELKENLKRWKTTLEMLFKMPTNKPEAQKVEVLQKNIVLETKAIDIEEKNIKILKEYKEVAEAHQKLAEEWFSTLQKGYQQNQQRTLGDQAQQEERKYLEQAAKLREELAQLKGTIPSTKRYLLEVKIQDADLRAQVSQLKLKLEPTKAELAQLHIIATQPDTYISTVLFKKGNSLVEKITLLREQLNNKMTLLEQQREMTRKRTETLKNKDLDNYQSVEKLLTDLIQDFQQLLTEFPDEQIIINDLQQSFFKSRRSLPNNFKEWQDLLKEISTLPTLFVQQLQTTWLSFNYNLTQVNNDRKLLVSIGFLLWFSFFFWIRHQLFRLFTLLKSNMLQGDGVNILLILLKTLNINVLGLILISIFLFFILLIQPSQENFIFSTTLIFSWLAAKVQIDFTYLWLSDDNGIRDNYFKLYRNLRWITLVVWFLLSLMVIGHVLEISLTLRNLLDSLFMVSLALTLHPILQIRRKILVSLEERLKNYWLWVIRLTSFLPLLLITTIFLLGLIGFINFGWAVAQVLGWFVIVLTGWLIARGLLVDGIVWLKNYALKHSDYGLLWTQDIIPLFHKLLEIGLFLLAGFVFLWLNGWYNNATVRMTVNDFFAQVLFTLGDKEVTASTVLMSILAVSIVVWFGKWLRQITYRWIYSGVTDLGVRNSLSVLTQYVVILLGLLITLRIVGIDLTTLTVFAGALGIGIGFGLQTIANNFISGIILLVERPLRKGDYVTIGTAYEGEVIDIGIRSLIIQAWNYQEIIVPNSEVISNTFTNWTHSDNIMRTTLYVCTCYEDDPERTLTVLSTVLVDIPEVLKDPEPDILLWEFADSWMVFRIDYYLDIMQYHGILVRMRSQVLIKIWQTLQKAGIDIAYPRQDTYLKAVPPISTVRESNTVREPKN